MNIAVIGCGYVADHYLETLERHPNLTLLGVCDLERKRAEILADHYGVDIYASAEDIFSDPRVQIVVCLTEPQQHYAINKAALLAGKHVYSEKPLSTVFSEAQELVALAQERGLMISGAPCSILSEAAQTLWKAILDGSVGDVRVVYAELDDNPIDLMKPEDWSNERGIPWPYLNEYMTGCTLEHAGYYLTWLAALFGPAESITAFSACVAPDKTDLPLDPADTPDFSVACIQFRSGVVARLTCSIVAPYDHRLRIIGNRGMLSVDECWHYGTPVYFERFSQVSLNARKLRTIRESSPLQTVFGVGGSSVPLAVDAASQLPKRWQEIRSGERTVARSLIKTVSKHELVAMDFFRGVAHMATALEQGEEPLINADFLLHVNEMALAIQAAGPAGAPYRMVSTFEPRSPLRETLESKHQYTADRQPTSWGRRVLNALIARAHRH